MKVVNSFNDLFLDSFTPLNKITNFLRKIDKKIKVELEVAFQYHIKDNTVFIGLERFTNPYENTALLHRELLEEFGYHYSIACRYETFCLLHELGHHKMRKKYGKQKFKDLLLDYSLSRGINMKVFKNGGQTERELQTNYMNNRIERDANEWAYNYILENIDEVRKFDNEYYRDILTMLRNKA